MTDAYLGIDQSYSGFAVSVLRADDTRADVTWEFPLKKHGAGVTRLVDIGQALCDFLEEQHDQATFICHACMEGYAPGSKFGREQAGELGAVVKLILMEWLPDPARFPTIVAPSSLKKFVTGEGRAAKDNMLLGVYMKWGVKYKDNNQADAHALARVAKALDTGQVQYDYEKAVLDKLTPHTERFPNAA